MREASRLSSRPGEDSCSTFTLPGHLEENLTAQQSAEKIVKYFALISQEYTPIEEDNSARWMEVQTQLDQSPCSHPEIEEYQIYKNMKEAKMTDTVPGDIPAKIMKEFLPEFATPITAILKEAVLTHTWPAIYKKEYHIPRKKIPNPTTEDDIRGIGLTSWISKQLERLVLNWIWPFVYPHIDNDQMGGMPGCSVEHYIIKMLHFILSNMDGKNDAAVLAVPVDFSKAFNRMLHSNILCNLDALNVPKCATKLIKSYLTRRSMCVKYKGEVSSFQDCPGGGPQGGLLTGILFIIQVNKAGHPCVPRRCEGLELSNRSSHWMEHKDKSEILDAEEDISRLEEAQEPASGMELNNIETISLEEERIPAPGMEDQNYPSRPCHDKSKLHKKSFIDDLTLLEKISLSNLVRKEKIIGPLNYHDRFNLTLPSQKCILQHKIADLQDFTREQHMKLNSSKTKCLPFINSMTKDFVPQILTEDNSCLEVIYQLKLVGIVITSQLTWSAHIEYTIGRVNKILWQITRFKRLEASQEKLITLYILKVRSVLMFGAVTFHSSLTQELSRKLELHQKKALAIILGSQYKSYNNALLLTALPRLDTLREEQCINWALKAQVHPKHSDMFPLTQTDVNTRYKKKFQEYFCRSSKYFNSAIPYMTRKLNDYYAMNPKK